MAQAGQTCDENNDEQLVAAREQETVEYLANAYGFAPNPWGPYYQPSRVPGKKKGIFCTNKAEYNIPVSLFIEYTNMYEGRTPGNRLPSVNPFRNYFSKSELFIMLKLRYTVHKRIRLKVERIASEI